MSYGEEKWRPPKTGDSKPVVKQQVDWSLCVWCDRKNKKVKGQGRCAECLVEREKGRKSI